jgi:hypothetical protein
MLSYPATIEHWMKASCIVEVLTWLRRLRVQIIRSPSLDHRNKIPLPIQSENWDMQGVYISNVEAKL